MIFTSARRSRGSEGTSRWEDVRDRTALCVIIAVLLLSPLLFGSAAAPAWGIWAVVVGLGAGAYYLASAALGLGIEWPRHIAGFAAMFLLLLCWLAIQAYAPWFSWQGLPVSSQAPPLHTVSIAPGMTALMLMRQLTYGLLFLLVAHVGADGGRRNLLFNCAIAITAVYAAYSLLALNTGDTILGRPKWAYPGAATGPFVNRNSFATYLSLGLVATHARLCSLLFGRRLNRSPWVEVAPYAAASLLVLAALIMTQSRMGMFAGIGGVILVTALAATRADARERLVAVTAGTLVCVIAVGWLMTADWLPERVDSVNESASIRWELYRQVHALILLRPWTGFGGGTFMLAFPLVHEWPVSPDLLWDRAHNTYLALVAELGIVGASILPVMLLWLAKRTFSALRRDPSAWSSRAAYLGALSVVAIHSLVDFSLEIQAVTLLFVVLCGLAASSLNVVNK